MSAACKPLSCWLFSLGFSTFKAEEQKPNPFRSCKKPHLPALLGQGCGSGLQHVHGGACSARPAAGAAETPCGRTRQHEPRGPWARGGRLSAAGPAPASKTPELPGCLPSPAQRHPPPWQCPGQWLHLACASCRPKTRTSAGEAMAPCRRDAQSL